MFKNKANVLIAIVLVVVIAGLVWYFTGRKSEPASPTNGQQQSNTPTPTATPTPITGELTSASMEGVLQKSNNTKKGNYMIAMEGKTLYISTSRDFNALVGKTVIVTYEGTPEDFTLGDIIAK